MNILHLTTFLQGGAGKIITELACVQKSRGQDVVVISDDNPVPGYASYPLYIDKLKSSRITHYQLSSLFQRNLALNVTVAEKVRELLYSHNIDLIHAHAAIPAMVGLLARSSGNHCIPVIMTMHGLGANKTQNQIKTDIAIMNMVDAIVPVSRASDAHLRTAGLSNACIKIIPNGVPEPNDVTMRQAGLQDDLKERIIGWQNQGKTIIGCIGTIGIRKNQACLVEALAKIKNDRFKCLLIGDEEEPGAMARLVASHGLKQQVYIAGYRENAGEILKSFSLLILPSRSEGLPLSIIEAFRDGIPVIGSMIASIEEIIEDGKTGRLFRDDDPGHLAEIITDLSRDKKGRERIIAKASQLFKNKYTLEVMIQSYDQLYNEMSRNRALAPSLIS